MRSLMRLMRPHSLRPALSRAYVPTRAGGPATGVQGPARPSGTDNQPRGSNRSFVLGATVGFATALATFLYTQNYILPERLTAIPPLATATDRRRAVDELRSRFPDAHSIDADDLHNHGSSNYFPRHDVGAPDIVVYPHTTADVVDIVRIAARRRLPVISYGAGTSIEGQFSPGRGGVCVDFSEMDQVKSLHPVDMTVVVQPGLSWQSLNEILDQQKTGLFFPVDPGPGATVGGCVGTSCSGPNAARYGTMKDWVLNMTVVLADGSVIRTRSDAKKSSSGYDLNHLFIGSEGTLGIVTEMTLKLTPKPTCEAVGTCVFDSVRQVTLAVSMAKAAGLDAQCLELVDGDNMPAINDYDPGLRFQEKPHLFFKLSGNAPSVVNDQRAALERMCKSTGGRDFTVAKDAQQAARIWGARKNLLLASLARNKDCVAMSTDVCVPVSKLPDLVHRYKQRAAEIGLPTSVLGHVADGNFHSLILYDDGEPEQVARADRLADELYGMALQLGGTVSGEHGIGSTKRHYLTREYGDMGVEMMWRIKDAFDPLGILNPGKLLPDKVDVSGDVTRTGH